MENVVETKTIQEGEISKAIKQFILANKKSPNDNDMLKNLSTNCKRSKKY